MLSMREARIRSKVTHPIYCQEPNLQSIPEPVGYIWMRVNTCGSVRCARASNTAKEPHVVTATFKDEREGATIKMATDR